METYMKSIRNYGELCTKTLYEGNRNYGEFMHEEPI